MKFTKITNSSKEGTLKPYWNGWLKERYRDCFAQISVNTTLKLKNAVKDVARFTLGSVPQDIEEWCKAFEVPPQGLSDEKFIIGYTNDEGYHQGSIERDEALKAYVNKYPEQWEIAKAALALPRQKGRHASAFVLSSAPISDFIPITTVSGVKVTAFTGPEVEAVGGLKYDWLVVNSILDIQNCITLIQETLGTKFSDLTIKGRKVPAHRQVIDPVSKQLVDIWELPEDMNVFENISSGKTETTFQLNTHSATQWLKYFNYKRPDGTPGINSIEAMAIFTALDRPGPLDYYVINPDDKTKHNIMVEYARRIRGLKGSEDILPIFDKLLPETNSLIVFQEQLQRIYQNLTGCTGAEAEEFRSNIAKKKKEKVDAAYKFFVEKAAKKIGKEGAESVWQGLATFGQYGFNKSHAHSYATISYTCAWLLHHYPLQWWCAVLRNATKDEISETFWPYVSHLVDLPDLNLSKPKWSIIDGRIRAPIDICFGIGETAHKQLCKYAPYTSLQDFCEKIVKHKMDNQVDGKWARSAITNGTIATLCNAGIMDGLFDDAFTIADRMDLFNETLKKVTKANGGKFIKSKVRYTTPDAIGRYQLKKEVLPVYSEDIRGHLCECDTIKKQDDKVFFKNTYWDSSEGHDSEELIRIVGLEELRSMDSSFEIPQGGWRCAIVAYVEDQKTFQYKNKGTNKTARKYLIDACGFKTEVVKWPSDFAQEKQISNGSIVVGIITKNQKARGWSFREIEVIRNPANTKQEEENEQNN